MGKRKPPPEHFERGFGKAGWVYVARNNMHQDDVYKIGYTEKTPEGRVLGLNTEQRNRTSQIGFFSLVYACAVLDAQGCEQEFFRRVARLLESSKKEFVNAPLELIVGELLHIQKSDNYAKLAFEKCGECGVTFGFCPLPQAIQQCPACKRWFQYRPEGGTQWGVSQDGPRKSYKPRAAGKQQRSPLADSFIQLQSAVKNYAKEGHWTLDDFIAAIDCLLEVDLPPDREMVDSRPVKPPRKARYTRARLVPTSRKGWMDCPDCLSSIQLVSGVATECVECGWILPEEISMTKQSAHANSELDGNGKEVPVTEENSDEAAAALANDFGDDFVQLLISVIDSRIARAMRKR